MALVKVAPLAQFAPGEVVEAIHADARYAICNVDGELFAVNGTCPHRGGPLAQGALHGPIIVCPWHAWEFDCRTGKHDYNPSIRLDTIPVRTSDGDVYLDLP